MNSAVDYDLKIGESPVIECLDTDILRIKNALTWGQYLIDTANNINKWVPAEEISQNGHEVTSFRTNSAVLVSQTSDSRFQIFEEGLFKVVGYSIEEYAKINKYIRVSVDSGYDLLKYEVGQRYLEHVDAVPNPSSYGFRRQLSVLIYLNDTYLGGELFFPRQNLRIKPSTGDVIVFPSNMCFPHEAMPVIEGTKYVIATWMALKWKD